MKDWKPFIWISIGIIVLWIVSAFVLSICFGIPEEAGTFGDMFGSINALFSGLALAGVIVAMSMQRQELSLQRKELEATRQELSKTAKASSEQAEIQSLSAQISGLNSLLESANSFIAHKTGVEYNNPQILEAQENIKLYRKEIKMKIYELSKITHLSKKENFPNYQA